LFFSSAFVSWLFVIVHVIVCPIAYYKRTEIRGVSKYGDYEDSPILAELYDHVPAYSGRPDRDFYLDYCRKADGKILEIGCGTGRILIPVAEAGCEIAGLDLSEHRLARCREKLADKADEVRDRVQLKQGNATDFRFDDLFQLAIIPFHMFQHIVSVEEQIACLKSVNRHLHMNGRLVFDVFQVNLTIIKNSPLNSEIEDLPQFELPDGRQLRRTHCITAVRRFEQCREVKLIYYLTDTDGTTRRITQAFPFRYFFRYELAHLLARCGFDVIDVFGDFDKSPLGDDSPELILVAEKTIPKN
jgi:ubiquinone/menaquinone biosynthesis C-methylase UbiE